MIEICNVSRNYETKKGFLKKVIETKEAVKDISIKVERGEIFGLLGPNGAGKTTIMKMLTTLLTPSKGSIEIDGLDCLKFKKEIQKRINFIYGGERSLYWRLSARDNLIYFADLYSVNEGIMFKRIDELLDLVGLKKYSHKKVETFSKGMKQRLQIARALINDPEIIFMDEPTIGLDPSASKLLHDIVHLLKEKGKTIVITTHYMKEAEELCDRVAFINEGEIIDIQTPSDHKKKIAKAMGRDANDLEEVYLHYFGEKRSVS